MSEQLNIPQNKKSAKALFYISYNTLLTSERKTTDAANLYLIATHK